MLALHAIPLYFRARMIWACSSKELAMNVPMSSRLLLRALLPAALLLLGACMSGGPTRAEKLAAYQAHAGAPVRQIRYHSPVGWEEVDDEHILLTMRPRENYLMRLSGPCLDFEAGSPVLVVSSTAGYIASGFDRVTVGASRLSCRIVEIRPLDMQSMRAAEARVQASGT
jgi:hypothetical protein